MDPFALNLSNTLAMVGFFEIRKGNSRVDFYAVAVCRAGTLLKVLFRIRFIAEALARANRSRHWGPFRPHISWSLGNHHTQRIALSCSEAFPAQKKTPAVFKPAGVSNIYL
jgi:hypothetical protein